MILIFGATKIQFWQENLSNIIFSAGANKKKRSTILYKFVFVISRDLWIMKGTLMKKKILKMIAVVTIACLLKRSKKQRSAAKSLL